MNTLRDLFPRSVKDQEASNVRKVFKSYKWKEQFYSSVVFSVGFAFILLPVLRFFLTGIWINKLPHETWLPYNVSSPLNYNLTLLWVNFIVFLAVTTLVGSDTTLYLVITLISMQFDILCRKLREMEKDTFSDLVKFHQTLIRLSDNVEEIFSLSIFFEFGSSILICFVGYEVSIDASMDSLIRNPIFLIAEMVQIFVLCYYGSKLMNASERVTDSLYSSCWYIDDNLRLKNSIILMLQRSQKPSVISVEKFSIISLKAHICKF